VVQLKNILRKITVESIPCYRTIHNEITDSKTGKSVKIVRNCDGRMIPEIKEVILNGNYTIFEIVWRCPKCGSVRYATYGY